MRRQSFLRTLVLGAIAAITEAQDCDRLAEYSSIILESPEDIPTMIGNCSIIGGGLTMRHGYTGEVVLPNLISIGAVLETSEPTYISVIDLPNLEHVNEGVDVSAAQVFLPKLNQTTTVEVVATVLDMNGLIEVRDISIHSDGADASINLDSLRNVTNKLYIAHCNICDPEPENAIDLSFPSLEFAGYIIFDYQISTILMPQLTSIGPPYDPDYFSLRPGHRDYSAGLLFRLDDAPDGLEVDFPKLSYVDKTFEIGGNVKGVSFPALNETRTHIDLHGAIEWANLNLTSFNTISITSTTDFDCDAFREALNQTSNYPEDGSSVKCTSTTSDHSGLSTRAKILIGVLVPVGVILVLLEIVWCWRRRRRGASKRRKVSGTTRAEERVEMPIRVITVQSTQSAGRSGAGAVAREGTPPPPYSRNPQ